MRGLPWYRRDVGWYRHPKIAELVTMRDGYRAAFVWDASIAFATEFGTNGRIKPSDLRTLDARKTDAERLVKVGLWDEDPDGGWMVHNFAEYQQTSQVTTELRAHRQAAAAKGNCIRHHGPACGCWRLRAVP